MSSKASAFFGILLFASSIQGKAASYCGSTPGGESLLKMLGIPTNEAPELIEWNLSLHPDAQTGQVVRYELRCRYGATVPNQPGLGAETKMIEQSGKCVVSRGNKLDAVVYKLEGAVELYSVKGDARVLHLLNADGTLMVGNGGYSYSLNSTEKSEKAVDLVLAGTVPDMSYKIDPLATGPNVHGVFEGRTPAQGISKQLGIDVPKSATKAKWRITFYQEADTKAPTTFKVEGTLFRPSARLGKWQLAADGKRTIYQLSFDEQGGDVRLLKGDDNVLFFLGADGKPLVGHCEFSYTLNRRTELPNVSQSRPAR